VPDARFVIWGEGPLRPALEGLSRSIGLENTVEFRGATARPEDALRGLEIFVLPSLSEASSNVVLEAMATGLAVVGTRVGGTPNLLDEGRCGRLVPPGDTPALAAAIVELIDKGSTRADLAAAARERAVTAFGLDRMVARMERLYCEALRRPTRWPERHGDPVSIKCD
jgi:glycosyltransferase involved in cell wall biosynthesis